MRLLRSISRYPVRYQVFLSMERLFKQFCKVVVLAFKAAYNMERTRRDNDKRITLLYVAMKDMLAALVQYVVSMSS